MGILSKSSFMLFLLISIAVFISNKSEAQSDTVSVSIQFVSFDATSDSLSITDAMEIDVDVNDIDFVNHVMITIYSTANNYPLVKVKYTTNELTALGQVNGNTMKVVIPDLEPTSSYRVETLVRNYQGANYPLNTTTYNGQ